MTALYAGSIMAVDGLWISHYEAAQIRIELEARGTKKAKFLADEISMPSNRVHRCDNETIYQHQREENARLRAALKPVLECKVMSAMTAEIEPGQSDYCANIIEKAQRIYNENRESEAKR